MQDYNYRMTNCFEITIEMGCYKYPFATDLKGYWQQHKFSLLHYLELVHEGIAGMIFDSATQAPIVDAEISLIQPGQEAHPVKSVKPYGDFWRVIAPGNYTVSQKSMRLSHKIQFR